MPGWAQLLLSHEPCTKQTPAVQATPANVPVTDANGTPVPAAPAAAAPPAAPQQAAPVAQAPAPAQSPVAQTPAVAPVLVACDLPILGTLNVTQAECDAAKARATAAQAAPVQQAPSVVAPPALQPAPPVASSAPVLVAPTPKPAANNLTWSPTPEGSSAPIGSGCYLVQSGEKLNRPGHTYYVGDYIWIPDGVATLWTSGGPIVAPAGYVTTNNCPFR
jgi:hypothetical protein